MLSSLETPLVRAVLPIIIFRQAPTSSAQTANFFDGCPTDLVQVIITDESVELLVVDDFISEPILGCDPSQFEEGGIDIKVLNSTKLHHRMVPAVTR